MKNAQLTLFMVLGMVLLVILLFIFVMLKDIQISQDTKKSEAEMINECVKQAAERGMYLIGIHGGSVSVGEFENVSYTWKNRTFRSKRYEKELESYINMELPSCNPRITNPEVQVIFAANVVIKQEKAYQISDGEQITTKDIYTELNIDMNRIIRTVNLITEQYALTGRFSETILPFDVHDRNGSIIVIITDSDSRVFNQPYRFAFALQRTVS